MNNFIDKMINFKEWRSYRFFENVNRGIIILASVVVFVLTIVTVVMRYIFKISIFGLDEVVMVVIFYVYFFGAAQGSLEDSQIRADMIGTLVHNKLVINLCHCAARLIEAIVIGICFCWSVTYILKDFQVMPYSLVLKIPLVVTHLTFLIGFLLMFLFSMAWFIRQCCITIDSIKGGTQR
ncbi:TRAP transporter small permease [Lachnospiraceae bacterium NSJ-143]|nr:TRAP transporter small permease [Lachnospiraceae bacterium NSJ-143]